jgi:nitrogen regulatory protein PII
MNNDMIKYQLIVTIVNNGIATKVIESSKKAGAVGGTVINGRGSSTNESAKIFGIPIEPEKEIILIVVNQDKAQDVLNQIEKDIKIDRPGNGIAFMLDVEKVVGINIKD